MTPPAHTERNKPHRFPGAIIRHGVWLSYGFSLRHRASTSVGGRGGKSPGQAPRLLSADAPMAHPCRPRRPLRAAAAGRDERRYRFESWGHMTGTERAVSGERGLGGALARLLRGSAATT
jgi:hypothetical protein